MFQIQWIGQGGFLLSDGKVKLAIDPYLSNLVEISDGLKRLVPPAVEPKDFHPDYIFLTHEHIDHLDTITVKEMPKEGVKFLAPPVCKKILLECGVSEDAITLLGEGETAVAGGFELKTVWADHTEGSLGVVITCDGVSVYFTGDSLWSEKLGDGIKVDVIECCINGRWGNMDHNEAACLTAKVGARLAIPNHYGMFAENTADPEDFRKALEGSGIAYYQMTYNQPFDVAALLK
ncbi:MAG: MBL fold metallo-hydrolase [Clostridia bacterium]|nr:MBL fold metallo-hydrolase [Clostridia bacterium]